ncbi:MAG TPA: NUDIX hydrolase [Acetobacteraceae bacterium]|jgi:hypothetical protein
MNGFRVHDFCAHPIIRVEHAMPPLDPALDAEIESLWSTASDRVAAGGAGALFNGRVFSADTITPDAIVGHLTEYRRIVAQMERPALFHALRLRPLAACGVLRCADGIVFGRRHASAVYQAGLWQLPPAGSVDANAVRPDGVVDVAGQLRAELREEVGLSPDDVDAPVPLCVVEHPGSHVCDFGMALTTSLNGEAVLAAHRVRGNGEYPTLRIVPLAELPDFVAAFRDEMVPPAPIFLRRAVSAGWT